jgi:hypothetical protein
MTRKEKLDLYVFIDAFGWEIFQRHSFLDDLLTFTAPLGTVFGYSSTCIPTILTGHMPQEHKHLSFFYYDPGGSPFAPCRPLRFLPDSISSRGRVRHQLSKVIKKLYGYSGYFQLYNMPFQSLHLFNYSEKKDIYQPEGINGGHATIFDTLRDNKVDFFLADWRASEQENIDALTDQLRKENHRLAYLYLPELDGLMHSHGTHSDLVAEKLNWYETRIRRVFEEAQNHYEEVELTVFSDHGMTDTIDCAPVMSRIESTGLRYGQDYVAVYDSTMARFWFLTESASSTITQALEAENRGQILTEEELTEYGCNFPDALYGELFFLTNPGVLLCPSHMGEKPLAAMHGYDPLHRDSVALFASNSKPAVEPRRLDDICGLMKASLNLSNGGTQ